VETFDDGKGDLISFIVLILEVTMLHVAVIVGVAVG
jgi:hypothetical protein